MQRRTVIALAVVATSLFAFIALYERHTLSSGEVEGRRGQLLERFVRDRVEQVTIEREGETLRLVHRRGADGALGEWRLTEPLDAAADEDAVYSLLGAMEWADSRRTLEDISDADRARYGLAEPVLTARFRIANETLEVRVGDEDPTGIGRYLGVAGDAHVVGRDVFEALDHDVSHFRSKRLLERGVLRATALRVPAGRLEASGPVWRLVTEELSVRARRGHVEEALQAFTDLRAERFVDDTRSAAETGIGTGWEARARREDGSEVRLRVGHPCGEHRDEVHVQVDDGPLACALASSLEALEREVEAWRDPRAVSVRDLELESLTLEAGPDRLELSQQAGRWVLEGTRGGRPLPSEVDGEALADWLRALGAERARRIVGADADTLRQHGLDAPRARLRLEASDERVEVLALGDETLEGVYARRDDEDALLVLDPAIVPLLQVDVTRLRARTLLSVDAGTLESLSIRRRQTEERLRKESEEWRIIAPVETAAGEGAVRDVATELAGLRALRFAADGRTDEHGLSAPRFVVRAAFDSREIVLRIGAQAAGGAFAQLEGDSVVFVVPSRFLQLIGTPLIDPNLLQTEVAYLEGLTLYRGDGPQWEMRHDGAGWVDASGARIDEERAQALADRVESLRVRGATRYGPPAAADGFAPPRARLEVHRSAEVGGPYTVLIGAPTGEGARVHARRQGLDVGLVLDGSFVQALLQFSP